MASCSDDVQPLAFDVEESIFSDPKFFLQTHCVAATSVRQFSTIGNIFLDSAVLSTPLLSSAKKRSVFDWCRNCRKSVHRLVFNCACSVECALAYHHEDKDVREFIEARYNLETNYARLETVPLPRLDAYLSQLYKQDDPRLACYTKQLSDNIVDGERWSKR